MCPSKSKTENKTVSSKKSNSGGTTQPKKQPSSKNKAALGKQKAGKKLPKNAPKAPAQPRQYNSPARQRQREETRERIVAAGAELVHTLPTWDWKSLTAKAVGERANVSERTVQRYFVTERQLRDAVLQRLVDESGVDLDALHLSGFAAVTAHMFSYLASFSVAPAEVVDPTFVSIDHRRREALLDAVARATPDWSESQKENAAAALDILWNPPPYERLITTWGFDADRAIEIITWLIGLIEAAIKEGNRPHPDR